MNVAIMSGHYVGNREKFYPARDGKISMLMCQICVKNGKNTYIYIDCRAYAETAESMHRNLSEKNPAIEVMGRTMRQKDGENLWRQYVVIDSWRYAPSSKAAPGVDPEYEDDKPAPVHQPATAAPGHQPATPTPTPESASRPYTNYSSAADPEDEDGLPFD